MGKKTGRLDYAAREGGFIKKKVLQLVHDLSTGGAETLVKDYALWLNQAGYDVVVLCFNRCGSPYEKLLQDKGVRVIYCSDKMPLYGRTDVCSRAFNRVQRYLLVKKIIHGESPDILHTHLPINTYISFARPRKGVKIFHTVHSEPGAYWCLEDKAKKGERDYLAAKSLVRQYGMRFIALHEKMRKEVDKLFEVNNTVVLNNGIDFSRFETLRSREETRTQLGMPRNAFVLGHVGRFAPVKNHVFLVEIFKEVCKRREDAFLLMVGDGPEKEHTAKLLDDAGLKERYLILSNRTDVPDLMNCMDVFAFPSKFEGLSIVSIEAQKIGLPVAAAAAVPAHATISNLVRRFEPSQSAAEWAEYICSAKRPEKIVYDHLEDWDMKNVVKRLSDIYEGRV